MPAPTIHWNLNADGNCATKADWTPHRLPKSTDNVSIDTADLHTVTHSTGTDFVNTLTVGNDDFVVSGGSLTINATSSLANLLTVSGGTLALGGAATAASFTQSGGTVSGASTLTVTGPTVFSGASLETGAGSTLLKGVTTFANNPAPAFDGGRILENQGTLTLLDAQEIDLGLNPFGKPLGGGTLKNDAGGTIIMGQASFIRPGAGAAFINAGTLESTAGSGGNVVGAPLTNTGKILVQSGDMALFGFTNSGPGTISISSGASLSLFGAGGSASASAFTVASGGKLDFFPGNHTPGVFSLGAGTIHGTGQVAVDGGELALGANAVTVTNFSQGINSTVSGSGTLTITGVGSFTASLQTGPGTTLFTASSLFGMGGYLDGGRVVENQGLGDLGVVLGANPFGPALGGGTIKNDVGGTLLLQGSTGVFNGAGANSFINAGTLVKTFAFEANGFAIIGVNFTDTGVIKIVTGTLEFSGAINSFSGSISEPGKTSSLPVTLSFGGGTSALNSGTTIKVTNFSLSDGAVVNVNETLDFKGRFSQTDAGTTLNVAGGDTLSFTGAASLAGAVGGAGTVSLANATIASLTVGGGTTLIDAGAVDQGGSIILGDAGGGAATLSIASGATYNIDNNWDISRGASLASSIQNGGALIKSGGTGTSVVGVAIADAGSIEAASGTLDLTQAITGGGTLTVDTSATLELGFSAAASLTASFNGANATLALGNPARFAATIAGFAATDTLHLVSRAATSATLGAGDTLVIHDGGKTVATLQLAGNFTGDTFHVASDGAGGALVTVTAPAAATTPASPGVAGAAHAFIAAMAGFGASGGGPGAAISPEHADAWRPSLSTPRLTHFA